MGVYSLGELSLEPAFRKLVPDPRFQRLRAQLNRELERERREIDPQLI
jgi:hypothetical protein